MRLCWWVPLLLLLLLLLQLLLLQLLLLLLLLLPSLPPPLQLAPYVIAFCTVILLHVLIAIRLRLWFKRDTKAGDYFSALQFLLDRFQVAIPHTPIS
jgi:hypothetical protein